MNHCHSICDLYYFLHLRQQFLVPIGCLSGGVSMLWETTLKGLLSSFCPLNYCSNNSCYDVINLIGVVKVYMLMRLLHPKRILMILQIPPLGFEGLRPP